VIYIFLSAKYVFLPVIYIFLSLKYINRRGKLIFFSKKYTNRRGIHIHFGSPSSQRGERGALRGAMLWELTLIFGRLGATSFGGPLAHIALMARVTLEFARHTAFPSAHLEGKALGLGALCAVVLGKSRVNSAWLLGEGAVVGWVLGPR